MKVKIPEQGPDPTSATWSAIKAAATSAGVNLGPVGPGGSAVTGWYANGDFSSDANDKVIDASTPIEPILTAKYSVNDGTGTKPASFDNFKYSEGGKTLAQIFAKANGDSTSSDVYQAPSKANTPKGYGFTGWKVTKPDGTVTVVEPSKIGTDTTKYPAGTKIEPNWEQLHVAQLPNDETMEFTEFREYTDTEFTTLDGFYIANTEVTRGQWLAVMGNDSDATTQYSRWWYVQQTGYAGALDMPMNNVSWFEVIVFCNKMSMLHNLKPYYYLADSNGNREYDPDKWVTSFGGKPPLYYDYDTTISEHKSISGDYYWNKVSDTGWNHIPHDWDNIKEDKERNGYRLPTLNQWKFAAKGGKDKPYSTYSGTTGTDPDALKKVAWYSENSGPNETNRDPKSVQKVGEKGGDNPVRDMSGNVWEWLWNADNSNNRIFHGGAYNGGDTNCNIDKTPGYNPPHTATRGIGFRIIEPIFK